jgi:hypothetical protein
MGHIAKLTFSHPDEMPKEVLELPHNSTVGVVNAD